MTDQPESSSRSGRHRFLTNRRGALRLQRGLSPRSPDSESGVQPPAEVRDDFPRPPAGTADPIKTDSSTENTPIPPGERSAYPPLKRPKIRPSERLPARPPSASTDRPAPGERLPKRPSARMRRSSESIPAPRASGLLSPAPAFMRRPGQESGQFKRPDSGDFAKPAEGREGSGEHKPLRPPTGRTPAPKASGLLRPPPASSPRPRLRTSSGSIPVPSSLLPGSTETPDPPSDAAGRLRELEQDRRRLEHQLQELRKGAEERDRRMKSAMSARTGSLKAKSVGLSEELETQRRRFQEAARERDNLKHELNALRGDLKRRQLDADRMMKKRIEGITRRLKERSGKERERLRARLEAEETRAAQFEKRCAEVETEKGRLQGRIEKEKERAEAAVREARARTQKAVRSALEKSEQKAREAEAFHREREHLLETELREIKEKYENRFEQQRENAASEEDRLHDELTRTRRELVLARKEADKIRALWRQGEQQKKEQGQLLEELETRLAEAREELRESREQLKLRTAVTEKLTRRLEERGRLGDAPTAAGREAELEARLEELQKEHEAALKAAKAESSGAIARYESEVVHRNAQLEHELDELRRERDDLRTGLDLASESVERLEEEREELVGVVERSNDPLRVEAERHLLEERLQTLQSELDRVQQREKQALARYEVQIQQLRRSYGEELAGQAKRALTALRDALKQAETRVDAAERSRTSAEQDLNKARRGYEAARTGETDETVEDEGSSLRSVALSGTGESAFAFVELATPESSELAELRERAAGLTDKNERLEAELAALRESLGETRRKLQDLESVRDETAQRLEATITAHREEVDALRVALARRRAPADESSTEWHAASLTRPRISAAWRHRAEHLLYNEETLAMVAEALLKSEGSGDWNALVGVDEDGAIATTVAAQAAREVAALEQRVGELRDHCGGATARSVGELQELLGLERTRLDHWTRTREGLLSDFSGGRRDLETLSRLAAMIIADRRIASEVTRVAVAVDSLDLALDGQASS